VHVHVHVHKQAQQRDTTVAFHSRHLRKPCSAAVLLLMMMLAGSHLLEDITVTELVDDCPAPAAAAATRQALQAAAN
jgi:hypothetical protein